jgi:hypothetical protein
MKQIPSSEANRSSATQKVPAYCENRMLITAFTTARSNPRLIYPFRNMIKSFCSEVVSISLRYNFYLYPFRYELHSVNCKAYGLPFC